MNNLAVNLRKLLATANISERELSRRTGVVHTVIHRILNNKSSNPTLQTLQAISEYFLISVSELLGEISTQDGKQSFNHLGWRHIPILSQEQIDFWLNGKNIEDTSFETITIDFEPTKKLFGLKLTNDALKPIFCSNDIIIVDPMKKPISGSYLIYWCSSEIKIGQFKIENNIGHIINSLNKFEDTVISKTSIIGQIIQLIKSL